jgi:hypothetical protein
MYRVIQSFSIGDTLYQIGDTIAESDNQAIEENSHYQKFVVRINVKQSDPFPTP